MRLGLALPLLFATCCCDALNVDYFDQQRRLTRVQYDPTVQAPKIATHDNHDRRLAGEGGSELPDVTLMVVNPDELYIHVSDTTVTLYGTEIHLEPHMWSSERDLVVKGAKVHLLGDMKFYPQYGQQKNVHIHAMDLIIPEDGATIDLKGEVGRSYFLPASDGSSPGRSGGNGANGGAGGAGGTVTIEAMNIYGGVLNINVDGGKGGNGQHGGDGAMGEVGQRRKDIDDCCKGNDAKGQKGNNGGDGGNAGKGGNGGDGGESGVVTLLLAEPVTDEDSGVTDGTHSHVVVSAQAGEPGKPAEAGTFGQGGSGGPGLMTACKRTDWFFFNRMCTFPIGPEGDRGSDGTNALNGTEGTAGTMHLPEVAERPLQELRAHGNGNSLRYEMFLADMYYRNSRFVEAQKLYVWIEAVLHTEHSDEDEGTVNLPWRQIALEASIRLTQLRRGLDFWGHQMHYVPLMSFDALHSTLTDLLRIAAKTEDAYETYFASTTTTENRRKQVTKAVKNLDFEISQKDQSIYQLKDTILGIRPEIIELQLEQDTQMKIVNAGAAECDGGIAKKAASEAHRFVPNVNRLILMATNGFTAAVEVAGLHNIAMGVWSAFTGNLPGLLSSLRPAVQEAGLKEVLNANIEGVIPAIRTVVTDVVVSPVTSPFSDAWDRISPAINEVEKAGVLKDETLEGLQIVTNLLLDAKDYRASREKYFDSVEECKPLSGKFSSLVGVSKRLQMMRVKHDMSVVKFASLKAERAKLASERREILDSVLGTFDPTSLPLMHSITEAYRDQKDRIIEMLKLMHEAVDFEFCDQNPFTYEEVRVMQLESFLAQVTSQRIRKHAEDTASRALLADVGEDGDRLNAVSVIKLRHEEGASEEVNMAFENYWANGTFSYNLEATNEALPKGVANMRVVSAQAFVPALLLAEQGSHEHAEVWLQKLGVSTCSSVRGVQRTFSHASTGYYSVYSANEDPRSYDGPPRWLTKPTQNTGSVSPTPLGPWSVSIPVLKTEEQRKVVTEVDLHIVVSYVPCNKASCGNDDVEEQEL